jgi:hypothetical protein
MPSEGLPNNNFGLDYVAAFNGMSFDKAGNMYAAGRLSLNYNATPSVNFGGAWVSRDDGATWTNISPSTVNVYDIKADSRNNQVLYACTTTGEVLVSYKGAETPAADWISLDDFSFSVPTGVHEDPTSPKHMYVTTFGGGIWRLELPVAVTGENGANTDSGNGFSVPQAAGCHDSAPQGEVDLFQINANKDKATLYWSPANDATGYAIFYKRSQSAWDNGDFHATTIDYSVAGAVNNLTINDLLPWADYDFRVVPMKGCAAGDSSNQLSTKKASQEVTFRWRE